MSIRSARGASSAAWLSASSDSQLQLSITERPSPRAVSITRRVARTPPDLASLTTTPSARPPAAWTLATSVQPSSRKTGSRSGRSR